jgi:hypothetical protein
LSHGLIFASDFDHKRRRENSALTAIPKETHPGTLQIGKAVLQCSPQTDPPDKRFQQEVGKPSGDAGDLFRVL